MSKDFEMSMVGEFNFFFQLQVKQDKKWIFINRSKYVLELNKKFGMDKAKDLKILMSTTSTSDKDEDGQDVNQKM